MSATHIALAYAGIDPMDVTSVDQAEGGNWTGWKTAKATKMALIQSAICGDVKYEYAEIKTGDSNDWLRTEKKLNFDDSFYGINDIHDVFFDRSVALAWLNNEDICSSNTEIIHGETYSKLLSCIHGFSNKYPDFSTRPPKLNDDVRPWLMNDHDCSDREAHVFSVIILEHFHLKKEA